MEFYFAYVDDGSVAFDAETHALKDERVYSVSYEQKEAGLAELTLRLKNPRVGLLAPSRKRWLWASYKIGEGAVTPYFFGRIVGMPDNVQEELLTALYVAHPNDFQTQKLALAETLKEFPYWDDVWVDPERRTDPDVVLEARPARWHVDPVTHEVTVSHINAGEDGTVVVDVDAQYYPSLNYGYVETPLMKVRVEAGVDWHQVAFGHVDLTQPLLQAFAAAGSPAGLVTSFTGQGLQADWPLPGDSIGGGWSHGYSNVGSPNIPTSGDDALPKRRVPLGRRTSVLSRVPSFFGGDSDEVVNVNVLEPNEGEDELFSVPFYRWSFAPPQFTVAYNADRVRSEALVFELEADVQEVMADNTDSFEIITINSNAVSEVIDEEPPIGDNRRRSYFNTQRGRRSLEYLIALAAHRLLVKARCVRVSLDIPFSVLETVSCRKNMQVIDPRLPGGEVVGKIVHYGFTLDGRTGRLVSNVTLASTVGKGNSLPEADPGDPTWAEEGVFELGIQEYTGGQTVALPGAVLYDDYAAEIEDDGLDLFNMTPDQVIAGARAENEFLVGPGLPEEGDMVVIGDTIYTFVEELADPDDILIGATTDECALNLAMAILGNEAVAGILFGFGTVSNPDVFVRATEQPNRMSVIARVPGEDANAIETTATGTNVFWRHETMLGGAPSPGGLKVVNGEDVQRDVLEGLAAPDGFVSFSPLNPDAGFKDLDSAIAELNAHATKVQLQLVPLTGGPFLTEYEIAVSKLHIPKQLDLSAESA
jgi:hypothetical protein